MGKVVEAVAIGVTVGVGLATGGFGLGLFAAWSTMAAVGVGAAAMSLSMTLMMKTPSASSYATQSERKQVLRSSASPKTVVYGKTVSAGTLIFAEEQSGEQTDGEWVHLVIVVAGHKLHGIGTIWLGDNTIDTYGEYASHELINDAQTVNQFLLDNCPSWKSDMIGKGVALLRVSLKFNADKYPSGIPNIKLEKQGREVYDPRDGLTKYSNNAALVILDYYRNYLNVADSELLWDYWKDAANICDEIVTNSDGTNEPRYTINGEFDLSETKTNVLDGMLLACAGDPVYIGGKHGLMVGAYYGPATIDLHDYQFSGDVSITPESSMTDRINSVTGKFVDPEQSYAETDFPAVTVDAWVEADGVEIKEDVTYRFVTSEWQAQRLANIKLRLKRYGRTIKVPMNMSGFAYRPGCYVNLYIKSLGIDGHTFRIRDWEFSAQNGITITLRDEPAEVYNGAIGSALIRSALTSLPTGSVAMPDNLQFVTEQIGDVMQGLLTWTNTGTVVVNNIIVRRDGVTVLTAQAPGQSCRLSGLPSGQYIAEVRAIALTGAQSPVAAVSFVIATPPVPQSVEVTAANWSLELRPVFSTALSFGTLCEFFFSTVNLPVSNVENVAKNLGISAYLVVSGLQTDTEYYFWVRAVNAYGKSALVSVIAKTTYDAASILSVLDNQLGAEHLRAELRTEIEKIAVNNESIAVNNESIAQIEADVSSLEIRQSAAELAQSSLSSALASAQDDIQENAEKISVTSVDVTALKTAQSALTATAQSLSSSVNSITVDLSSLTTRQAQAEAILKSAQDLLGKTTIDVSLLHDQLSQQVQKYGADVQNLTDAILTVNPETGEITIDAVNVVKTELQSKINEVSQRVSSVEGVLTQKASTVDVDLQAQRISTVESQMSSINAELTNQVTRSEFTETTEDVTQLTTRMAAAEGVISTKAAQQTVDALGMRLSSAETALSVSNTTNQSQAQQISALQSDLTTDITDVKSQVSTVANSLSTQAQAIGSRIDDVIADYKAADSESNAAINEVSQALSSASSATAAQISNISTSVSALQSSVSQLSQSVTDGDETTASLYTQVNAINNSVSTIQGTISQLSEALATEKGTSVSIYQQLKAQADAVAIAASQAALDGDVLNRTYRNNAATVQSQIKAVVSSSESLAQTVDVLSANFESETAELLAKIATEQTARTTADESLADSITSLSASYKSADAVLTASIQAESQTRANEDSALSSRIDTLSVSTTGNAASIQSEATARASADSALSNKIDVLTASTTADKTSLSAQISSLSQTVTSNNESLSEQISDLDAKYGSETSGLSARITQNNTARVSAESALSSRVDSVESAYKTADSSLNAKIASETTARSDADSALGTRIDEVSVSVNSNSAAITAEQSARSSADSAMAQQIVDLSSSVKAGDDSLNAKITTLSQSTTTADQALSQRADNIEAAYKSADATQSAAISSLSSAVSDFESSTATQFSELNSSVDGLSGDVLVLQQTTATQSEITASVYEHLQAKTEVAAIAAATAALSDDESTRQRRYSEASIKHDVAVLTNDHEALAHTVEVLQADFETETANISAQITNEQTSRSTAIESLAQVISTIDATYKSADTANNARIATEETARAAADSALSTRVDQVIATVNSNTAVIQSEQVARATADDALVQQINSVHALVDENVSSIQSEQTARVTADEALAHDIETLFSSVDGNSSAIQNEKIVRSSADAALSSRIDTVQATTNGLTASVNTVSQAQSSTDGELNALWATKAQVAGSVSGFGLEVTLNEDGSVLSSFVIDADVFAVLSRASGATSKIHPFVVKNGTVYIDHALIDSAEIDSLISTYISVTELNGKTIRGANLIGGTLAIGSGDNSCFMEGGSIGIGKGGPYGGWGWGWHTIIYNDGGIYTDRLHASSGDFTGYVHATSGYFENVTINENCDVLGTIYADKIVGDVVAAKMSNKSQTYTITSSPKTRFLTATAQVNASSYTSQYQTITATASLRLYVDGVLQDTGSVEGTIFGPGTAVARGTASVKATISANTNHTYRLEWNGGDGAIPVILFAETSGSIY